MNVKKQRISISKELVNSMANRELHLEHIQSKMNMKLMEDISKSHPVRSKITETSYEYEREVFIFTKEELDKYVKSLMINEEYKHEV